MKLQEVVVPFPDRKGQVQAQKQQEFAKKVRDAHANIGNVFDAQKQAEEAVRKFVSNVDDKIVKQRADVKMAIRPLAAEYQDNMDPIKIIAWNLDTDDEDSRYKKLAVAYANDHIDDLISRVEAELAEYQKIAEHVKTKMAQTVVGPEYLFRDTGLRDRIFEVNNKLNVLRDYKRTLNKQ